MEQRETPIDNLDAFYNEEQKQLDQILSDIRFLADHGSYVQAAKRFWELRKGLESHFETDAALFVSSFADDRNDPRGARSLLLHEQAQLRILIAELSEALSEWNHPIVCKLLKIVRMFLKEHYRRDHQLAQVAGAASLGSVHASDVLCSAAIQMKNNTIASER